ncbi:uncharacterized protein TRAVEDRAFT_147380 [Trametes versicolor FP-101664 SS1]|uniref:uncharacterized protein n=1 Tax=Trametes versicolor (strain FP-101664) TaxID=717944 RepID=UPI0004623434|nr:uncharacterized protein TRAVEDRAFT_147380 [Trametes versicolor FP-101664 SS1]EIW59402.1 hypothetical protein TRAVEDRAFT_147380 [Trametes versicolor FP-101664 SS1]
MSSSRDRSRLRAHDDPELVDDLNDLLDKLDMQLPFTLETTFDLTPSLLLGILESILESRLPITAAIRASRDFASKVQAMKIFLGVFESDVLGGVDVGLSDIDPRRLAAGEEEEVMFVGELLCWLGRQRGILPPGAGPSQEDDFPPSLPKQQRAMSPSTHSTVTSGIHSNLSMMPTALAETDTTVMSVASEPLPPLAQAALPDLPSLPPVPDHAASASGSGSLRRQPRCIHEVDDTSFLADLSLESSTSVCHCTTSDAEDDLPATPKSPPPIRRAGWINHADEKSELDFYHRRRAPSSAPATAARRVHSSPGLTTPAPMRPRESTLGSTPRRIITSHNAPTQYTLALLNERARLLDELAKLKAASLVK